MDFLFVTRQEIDALTGLPYIQQVTYLLGIRPYMDRKSFIVGIKRGISYQSLAEILYIEPHQGIQSGSPSRPQVRRIVKSLERTGLIEIKSVGKKLILKCLLATTDISTQNKPDTKPSHLPVLSTNAQQADRSVNYAKTEKNPDIGKSAKADTPHNSENYFVFVCQKFEKFWLTYPQQQNKQKAFEEFKKLNPDDALFFKMMDALVKQIKHYRQLQTTGLWVPNWKYPANWLAQQSWNDELITHNSEESANATHYTNTKKQSPCDIFWASCPDGASLDFEDDQPEQPSQHDACDPDKACDSRQTH